MHTLLWALPIALTLHVTEEFAFPGGFTRWVALHSSRKVKSTRYYVLVNAAAILGTLAIALLAHGQIGYWMYLYSAGLMAANSVSHLRASYQTRTYCPGSLTAGLLLIPLLIVASWQFIAKDAVAWPIAAFGVVLGLIVGIVVFAVDARPWQMPRSSPDQLN